MSFENEDQKNSYAFGVDVAGQLQPFAEDLDVEAFASALKDVFAGNDLALNAEELRAASQAFQMKAQQRQQQAAAVAGEANMEAGQKFLEENKANEGVEVTESGLQYKVLTPAEGDKPAATDQVKVHYEGKLLDGTVFDSSYQRGEPITFGLNQVIPGWTEGVQLMSIGATYEFYIPSELAYGANGAGAAIPPNATLIFKVELLGIN